MYASIYEVGPSCWKLATRSIVRINKENVLKLIFSYDRTTRHINQINTTACKMVCVAMGILSCFRSPEQAIHITMVLFMPRRRFVFTQAP